MRIIYASFQKNAFLFSWTLFSCLFYSMTHSFGRNVFILCFFESSSSWDNHIALFCKCVFSWPQMRASGQQSKLLMCLRLWVYLRSFVFFDHFYWTHKPETTVWNWNVITSSVHLKPPQNTTKYFSSSVLKRTYMLMVNIIVTKLRTVDILCAFIY